MPVFTVLEKWRKKPDIIIWHTGKKVLQIMGITVPIDTNLKAASKDKELKYVPLISNIQRADKDLKVSNRHKSQWEP